MYDMPASQNRLGSTGFGSLLPERIISDLRILGAVHPSFRYLGHLPVVYGSPQLPSELVAILRVPYVGLVLAISMIRDSILLSIVGSLDLLA